jgi:hypothetical protein
MSMSKLPEIYLRSIPHKEQRYETVGDWFELPNGVIAIRTSELSDWRKEFLILVHELVEWGLCKHAGVTQAQVDKFDKKYEKEQDEVELGDLKNAPYRKQHCLATAVERMLAAELDVPWNDYEEELIKLME